MPALYPILLDLSERLIVIVGGGRVAARKAIGLIDAGATLVRVVAPEISNAMPDTVERVSQEYRADHLVDAMLVFAATNLPAVNEQVVRDARTLRILVSRADDGADGDFIVPAVHRDGLIQIAVSAGSPALSATIRDEIADLRHETWRSLAEELKSLRPQILNSELPASERAEVLRALGSHDALCAVEEHGADGLRTWLTARFPNLQSILHAGSR